MTKEQFVNRMAKNGKINKVTALEYTNLFMDTLTECIKEDGKVILFVKSPKEITKEVVTDEGIKVTDEADFEIKIK